MEWVWRDGRMLVRGNGGNSRDDGWARRNLKRMETEVRGGKEDGKQGGS